MIFSLKKKYQISYLCWLLNVSKSGYYKWIKNGMNEFNNKTIDKLLLAFNITRSLSKKGCPYDNAVAEATFKTFKTEFINEKNFISLIQLKLELFDYINWYNNIRIHSTLKYLTPVKYEEQMSTKK